MKKGSSDYFGSKAARGSSPTVSLAADLAQNFTIDQRCVVTHPTIVNASIRLTAICSPQLPTPRRSLFTTNIFQRAENKGKLLCVSVGFHCSTVSD